MLEDGRNSARSCNYGGVRDGIGKKRASEFSIKSKKTEIVKEGPNLPRYLKHRDLEMLWRVDDLLRCCGGGEDMIATDMPLHTLNQEVGSQYYF